MQIIKLNQQEQQCLHLSIQGYSLIEIASRMFRSKESVKAYRRNILDKFNAKNMLQAIYFASKQNLI